MPSIRFSGCVGEVDIPQAQQANFEGMVLRKPEIDFITLAQSLGVQAQRTSEPDEVSAWIKDSFQADVLTLLEVPISRDSPLQLDNG